MALPAPPPGGGHFVLVNGKPQLIHAIGPGRWAPGPPSHGGGHGGHGAPHAPSMAGPGVPTNSPLLNPGQPLSGQALYNAAKALADAQTAGPLGELAKSIASNTAQTQGTIKQVGGYLGPLEQSAQQGVTDQQNIANQTNQQLQSIGSQEQQGLGNIAQNAQQSVLAYSPQSDASNSLAAPAMQALTTELARQQGLAAQGQGAFRSFGATQGGNYGGLAASQLGTDALAGAQTLKGIAQSGQVRNEPLEAKVAGLQAQHGALLTTDLGRLRQQEVANRFTSQGLGIKQQALNTTAQNDRARNSLTARGQNITLNGQQLAQMRSDRTFQLDQQKFGAAQAKDAYLRSHGLGPYRLPGAGGKLPATTPTGQRTLSPQQQQVKFGQIDALRQLILDAQQKGLKEPDIRAMLADGRNPSKVRFDPALIDSAYALQGWGFLTNTQITELNKLGLIVGNRYRRGSLPPANLPVGSAHR